jgi:hypothetical protein
MLRLAYHDAGTFSKKAGDGGLNASIQFELDRPENFGLKRGWRLVEQVRGSRVVVVVCVCVCVWEGCGEGKGGSNVGGRSGW